jgi:hypothetical protein
MKSRHTSLYELFFGVKTKSKIQTPHVEEANHNPVKNAYEFIQERNIFDRIM